MKRVSKGFTLIELMIVLAIIAILLSLALPAYQDLTIRSKVAEGLSIASGVKSLLAESCQTSPDATLGSLSMQGYSINSTYVEWLDGGTLWDSDCTTPILGFQSRNTGADTEVIIVLQGHMGQGRMAWQCFLVQGEPQHVPSECRNPWESPLT